MWRSELEPGIFSALCILTLLYSWEELVSSYVIVLFFSVSSCSFLIQFFFFFFFFFFRERHKYAWGSVSYIDLFLFENRYFAWGSCCIFPRFFMFNRFFVSLIGFFFSFFFLFLSLLNELGKDKKKHFDTIPQPFVSSIVEIIWQVFNLF